MLTLKFQCVKIEINVESKGSVITQTNTAVLNFSSYLKMWPLFKGSAYLQRKEAKLFLATQYTMSMNQYRIDGKLSKVTLNCNTM